MNKLLIDAETIDKGITKEEWLKNKDEYDFILIDRDVIAKSSARTAMILSVIEWKDTIDTRVLKEYVDIGEKAIKRHIKWLKDNGYLPGKEVSQEDIRSMVLSAKLNYTCEWCNEMVYILHEHHYPIPKRDGGDKTVSICPNCHSTFHKIEMEQNGGWGNE